MESIKLQELQEHLEKEEQQEQEKKDYSSFDNFSKKIVTLVGYLIGLKDDILANAPFNQSYLENIKQIKEVNIIRALCSLRYSFILNYDKIYKERDTEGPFARFEKMDKWVDTKSLEFLKSQSIEPLEVGVELKDFTKHVANINFLIEENIDGVHNYFPEWISWPYIKDLFIMPNCSSGINGINYNNKKRALQINNHIHEIRKDFYEHITFYPYKIYLNWNKKKRLDDTGNILFNDCKFLNKLYDAHYDTFKGEQYVIDAKDEVKNSIYDFVEQSENVAIFVDCENIDPYKFAAVFKNLDEEKLSKIKKIVLYDDEHTTNAWDILNDIISIDIEHELVERIKDEKSLVDHAMNIGVTKAVYQDKIDSVVIASSDSDFWSLIKYLPEVKFFVMNESMRTAKAIIEKLDDYKVPHCFMDDFAMDKIQPYKNKVLKGNLQSIIDEFNLTGNLEFLDIDELLEKVFQRAGIEVPYKQLMKEKEDFFTKFIKKMKLSIEINEETRRFVLNIVD